MIEIAVKTNFFNLKKLEIPIIRATGGGRMFEQLERFIEDNSEEILIIDG